MKIPRRYLPKSLSKRDTTLQRKSLKKSRSAYKKGKYISRPKLKSFKSKRSHHLITAERMYKLKKISLSSELAKKTKCKLASLKKIMRKGEGAFYSSGSRPNQTAHSWGYARLASAITGGKASAVDINILRSGCKKDSKALKLASRNYSKYKGGRRRTKSVKL